MVFAITGDGVFAAMVGIGHASPAVAVDRAVVGAGIVADDGGRCGCVAGDAFADGGFEFAVPELWPGETPAASCAGATYVVDGATAVTGGAAGVVGGADGGAGALRCDSSFAAASSPRRRFVPRVVLSFRPKAVAFKRI